MPAFYDGGWSSMNMDDWQLDIDTPLKAIERIAQRDWSAGVQKDLLTESLGVCMVKHGLACNY
jgi:hypothetical protein